MAIRRVSDSHRSARAQSSCSPLATSTRSENAQESLSRVTRLLTRSKDAVLSCSLRKVDVELSSRAEVDAQAHQVGRWRTSGVAVCAFALSGANVCVGFSRRCGSCKRWWTLTRRAWRPRHTAMGFGRQREL